MRVTVSSASPVLPPKFGWRLTANADRILNLMRRAEDEQVDVLLFPELCMTGYTCADLFHQPVLQQSGLRLTDPPGRTERSLYSGLAVVGLPLPMLDQVYNCAAILKSGQILGIVPKTYLPNSRELYEARWFAPGSRLACSSIDLGSIAGTATANMGQVPVGADLFRRQPGFSGPDRGRGNMRGSVGAYSAQLAPGSGRSDLAAQLFRQQ